MHQKTPLISNRYAKQLAIGFASFSGLTCKSKNRGFVKVIFVCYHRLLKNVIFETYAHKYVKQGFNVWMQNQCTVYLYCQYKSSPLASTAAHR